MDKTVSSARGRRRLTRGGEPAVDVEPVSGPCANGIVVPQPEAHPELVRDCEVLLSLRDTLTRQVGGWGAPFGEQLRSLRRRVAGDSLNWDAARPLAEWKGIGVAADSVSLRVVVLSLVGISLQGTLPPELGQLSSLQRLYLSANRLTGSLPPELGQLSSLQLLVLSDNRLTGPVPPALDQLGQLRGLNLSGNRLTGRIPPELGQLAQLRWLNLADNQLTGHIPPVLGRLTHLEWLALSGNPLTGSIPASLQNVPDNDLDQLGLSVCS